jgi:hypothetical protein
MDSNFFFPVTIHQDGVSVVNVATWVQQLPIAPSLTSAVATLTSTEGVQPQGMYLYDTNLFRWRYLVPYANVCQAIIDGSTIDLYYQVEAVVTPPENSLIWRNGVLYSGTEIDTTPNVAWAVLTSPTSGSVTSVNNVGPDANGNVSIGISNIPGLQTALNNAGTVKSVNSQMPNAAGNVTLSAVDNNDASGTTLIVDNGESDGTFKFKTLVAGANVMLSADANGNIEIAATGDTGVTSVALSMPSIFNVSGSPVTSTGTLTATLTNQTANTFFRGPDSGSANIPTFGPIVAADLPLATTSSAGAVIVGSGLGVAAGTITANVLTVAGRTGNVVLAVSDVSGAAPLASPTFTGLPLAPTASPGTNTTQIATTAFVQAAVSGATLPIATTSTLGGVIVSSGLAINGSGDLSANVLTVAGRTGNVVLAVADVSGAAPLASPTFTGLPLAPTASPGTNTTQIATTAFVEAAVTAGSVTSFNTRTGAVTLLNTDISGAGGALIASANVWTGANDFTGGSITVTTQTAGNNTTFAASTAFVANAVTGLAPLASPTFTGLPLAPTATAGTNNTQIATTAYAYNVAQGSQTIPLASTTPVVLTAAQYSVPVLFFTGALSASITVTVPTTGEWNVINATTGSFTVTLSNGTGATQVIPQSTTTFTPVVSNATEGVVALAASAGVTSFNARTGAVTLQAADVTNVGGALLASPAFTGRPQIPASTYSVSPLGNVSGSPVTVNLSTAAEFSMTITGATTFAFSNAPGSNLGQVVYFRMTNAGSATISWPTGTLFAGGTAPTFTASGIDLIGIRYDATSSVYTVFVIGLNLLT